MKKEAIKLLLDIAEAAYWAMEDSEAHVDESHTITAEQSMTLCRLCDRLDELPEPEGNVRYSGPAKIRRLLSKEAQP